MPRRARSGRLTGRSGGKPGPPSAARPPQDPRRSTPVRLSFSISAHKRTGDGSLARSVRGRCGRLHANRGECIRPGRLLSGRSQDRQRCGGLLIPRHIQPICTPTEPQRLSDEARRSADLASLDCQSTRRARAEFLSAVLSGTLQLGDSLHQIWT